MNKDAKPFIGAMVVWTCPCGRDKGLELPAVVVKVHSENRCDLNVFTGNPADTAHFSRHYFPSRFDKEGKELGSWHWPQG